MNELGKPNLVLIGLMGSGKSSVGRGLADWLGYHLSDIDAQIEFETGREIRQIFESEGEAAFRTRERAAIQAAAQQSPSVIATGGGAFMDASNREALRRSGWIVYLRASPEHLFERVRHSRHRPLLEVDDPLARLRDLLAVRGPIYETADAIVDTDSMDRDAVVQAVLALYQNARTNDVA